MKVFGIDPGLVHTGWGAILKPSSDSRHVLDWGVISPPKHLSLSKRLAFLGENLSLALKAVNPDIVSIEKTFFGRGASASLALAFARGICLAAAGSLDVPVFECAPTTLKKKLTGNGSASKAQVRFFISQELNIPSSVPSHVADALAAAFIYNSTNIN